MRVKKPENPLNIRKQLFFRGQKKIYPLIKRKKCGFGGTLRKKKTSCLFFPAANVVRVVSVLRNDAPSLARGGGDTYLFATPPGNFFLPRT